MAVVWGIDGIVARRFSTIEGNCATMFLSQLRAIVLLWSSHCFAELLDDWSFGKLGVGVWSAVEQMPLGLF